MRKSRKKQKEVIVTYGRAVERVLDPESTRPSRDRREGQPRTEPKRNFLTIVKSTDTVHLGKPQPQPTSEVKASKWLRGWARDENIPPELVNQAVKLVVDAAILDPDTIAVPNAGLKFGKRTKDIARKQARQIVLEMDASGVWQGVMIQTLEKSILEETEGHYNRR